MSHDQRISILFVDDEPRILDGLRRMLRSMRKEWEMAFAHGAHQALAHLQAHPCDVLVTDIRMPEMTGVELMEQVRSTYPHIIRVALSGQASRETVLRSVGPAHQYLPKPCDADAIKGTLRRLEMLRNLLDSQPLREAITSLESLPSLPNLCDELRQVVEAPRPAIEAVADIISRDVAMSGRVVQLVSSGFFGPPRFVHDPRQAVSVLGMDIIKPLVLAMKVFTRFDLDQAERFAMSHLWDHSLRTASCARRIADAEHADSADTDAAFMAGLFHDVGKAVLARQLPEPFDRIEEQIAQGRPRLDAERDALQATHAEVGAYLLGVWGLIDPVVDAVAYHHQPARSTRCEGFSPLTAVHVANVFCRSRAGGNPPDAWTENLDRTYLETVGLDGRIDHWGQAMAAGPEGQPHHV